MMLNVKISIHSEESTEEFLSFSLTVLILFVYLFFSICNGRKFVCTVQRTKKNENKTVISRDNMGLRFKNRMLIMHSDHFRWNNIINNNNNNNKISYGFE